MSSHYPNKHNNTPDSSDTETFQDITILNQPSGLLEFGNKKGYETLTWQFHDGSHQKYTNETIQTLNVNNVQQHTIGKTFVKHMDNVTTTYEGNVETIHFGDSTEKVGDIDGWLKPQNEHKQLLMDLHDEKRTFDVMRTKSHGGIGQSSLQEKDGALAACPMDEIAITVITGEPATFTAGDSNCILPIAPSVRSGKITYEALAGGGGVRFDDGWGCFNCWGTGESPSSQDGEWTKEAIKDEIAAHMEDLVEPLANKEKELGQSKTPQGGSKSSIVSKDKFESIGLAFNDMIPYRIDPKGKFVPYGIKIDPFGKGVYPQYRETSLIEVVHADSPIGGDWIVNVGNKWNVNVGANGISIKTLGKAEMFAPIYHIVGEEIQLRADGEISIGAERINIEGEVITLRPKSVIREIEDATGAIRDLPANDKTETEAERQVLVDGNLNVEQNIIAKGGMHVEGEVTLHHITAPLEWQITEEDFEYTQHDECGDSVSRRGTYADMVPGKTIGYVIVSSGSSAGVYNVISTCATDAVSVHRHHHYFPSLPMRLMDGNTDFEVTVGDLTEETTLTPHDAVRAVGARNNFDYPAVALPISHAEQSKKHVYTKFGGWEGCDVFTIDNGAVGGIVPEKTPKPEGNGEGTTMEDDLAAKKKEIDEYFDKKMEEYKQKLTKLERGKNGYEE
jgi:hypothetical protein